MLLSAEARGAATEAQVKPTDCYKRAHEAILTAIQRLSAQGSPVDLVTVDEELRRTGMSTMVGGRDALAALIADTPSVTNAAKYAAIVRDAARLRRLIAAAAEISELGYDPTADATDAMTTAMQKLLDLDHSGTSGTWSMSDVLEMAIKEIDAAHEHGTPVGVLATGYGDLDTLLTGGLREGELVVIGARPAMGKTTLALNIAANVARSGGRVLFASLEMGANELGSKLICSEGRVSLAKARRGTLNPTERERFYAAASSLTTVDFQTLDSAQVAVPAIRAQAQRMRARDGVDLVIVDYVQLMDGEGENRQTTIASISRGLKVLARDLRIPVIALSQLSRALEGRSDKRPMLADLRESGSLEQDASVVMGIYRDEVYYAASPDRGMAEVIVLKNRMGPTGVAQLAWLAEISRFESLAR
jgi:replicative DNA helicase